MDWKSKVFSRKFLLAVAAMLASLGTGITGIATSTDWLIGVGLLCTVGSGALYAFAEAYVDAASVASKTTATSISATTTAKDVVQKAMSDGQ